MLRSYIHAVSRLECAPERYGALLKALNAALRRTEPIVAPLVHLIDAFEAEIIDDGVAPPDPTSPPSPLRS